MNETEKYLEKVASGLKRLPEHERNEILNEIRSHIYEAVNQQEPEQEVLERLGSPVKLAQSYDSLHSIESGQSIFNNLAFYFSAGVSSIFIVPILFFLTLAFASSAIIVVVYSIIDLLFVLPEHVVDFVGFTVTSFPALMVIIAFGSMFLLIAYLLWKLLRKFCAFVSLRYQKLRLKK
ncbi:MAG: DUF1700 domain-containing protein [Methanimicrococcus sp.]|nr:DUF1700 domain-containing protein [Methanimicrococcus sp.]